MVVLYWKPLWTYHTLCLMNLKSCHTCASMNTSPVFIMFPCELNHVRNTAVTGGTTLSYRYFIQCQFNYNQVIKMMKANTHYQVCQAVRCDYLRTLDISSGNRYQGRFYFTFSRVRSYHIFSVPSYFTTQISLWGLSYML